MIKRFCDITYDEIVDGVDCVSTKTKARVFFNNGKSVCMEVTLGSDCIWNRGNVSKRGF